MAHPYFDYEEAMQDAYWYDQEPARKLKNDLADWFCDLYLELKGSGTLNVELVERCLEEMAHILDIPSHAYNLNVIRKPSPNVPVYVRPTKAQLEQVK